IVLPLDRRFNFVGWRKILLFVVLQMYIVVAIGSMVYFMRKSAIAGEESLPAELLWVRTRTTHIFMKPDVNAEYAQYVGTAAAIFPTASICAMIIQLVREVKKGMLNSSTATRRYQRMAVRSLILQGVVPSMVYQVPSFANAGLQMSSSIFETGDNFDRIAMIVSPLLYQINTTHTFVSSLTILYCFPSFRR
ncbi:hypothetical protein PMAYCL1PPCAC_32386, partial [Pristionchus mayeri]